MKRAATWLIYIVGAISVGYLALYAYAIWRGNPLQPGDPIKIFRRDDAPSFRNIVIAGLGPAIHQRFSRE